MKKILGLISKFFRRVRNARREEKNYVYYTVIKLIIGILFFTYVYIKEDGFLSQVKSLILFSGIVTILGIIIHDFFKKNWFDVKELEKHYSSVLGNNKKLKIFFLVMFLGPFLTVLFFRKGYKLGLMCFLELKTSSFFTLSLVGGETIWYFICKTMVAFWQFLDSMFATFLRYLLT